MNSGNISIAEADWSRDQALLEQVRVAVFVDEQGVAASLEMDGQDAHCRHLIAIDHDRKPGLAIGTVRLLADGRIGRLAVRQDYRGRGIGSTLLTTVVQLAQQTGLKRLYLHAQSQASGFYRAHGFQADGGEFVEAGINHCNMILDLRDNTAD